MLSKIKEHTYKRLLNNKKMNAEDVVNDYQKMIENIQKSANEEIYELIKERDRVLHEYCKINLFVPCLRCGNELLIGKTAEEATTVKTNSGEVVTVFICQNCGKIHRYTRDHLGFVQYKGNSKMVPSFRSLRSKEAPLRDAYYKRIGKEI